MGCLSSRTCSCLAPGSRYSRNAAMHSNTGWLTLLLRYDKEAKVRRDTGGSPGNRLLPLAQGVAHSQFEGESADYNMVLIPPAVSLAFVLGDAISSKMHAVKVPRRPKPDRMPTTPGRARRSYDGAATAPNLTVPSGRLDMNMRPLSVPKHPTRAHIR
ncbi:hypothetical protein VTK26DRAFT_3234 [Humicola hyalothermophila]